MRRLSVLGAVLTALMIPSVADAHPTVQDSLQIAYAADPNARCAGHVTVLWDATLDSRGHDEEAYVGTCVIAVNPQLKNAPQRLCDVIVHGVKHLAGYQHTTTGIMAPHGGEWPACHPHVTTRQGVRELLPHGYDWRVTCTRSRCWAKAKGVHVRRYRVTNDGGIYER